jgi:hypothetical protein
MSLKTLLPRQFGPVLAFAVALTPFIPVQVGAAEVAAPAVSLTWTPNPEANLAGYKLHFGTSSGSYATVVDLGAVPSAPLPPMILGQTYFIALSAYDTEGRESPLSEELTVTAAPPGPVAGTGFATGSAGLGKLQWRYPSTAAGTTDRFTIESSADLITWSPAGSLTPAEADRSDAEWLHFSFDFPTDQPRRFFRVAAVNPFGVSD